MPTRQAPKGICLRTEITKTVNLEKLIEDVIDTMKSQKNSDKYINTCNIVWRKLKTFTGNSVHSIDYSPEFLRDFMLNSMNFGSDSKSKYQCKRDINALYILYNYLHYKRISYKKPLFAPDFSMPTRKEFNDYISQLKESKLSISTLESKQFDLKKFDDFLVNYNLKQLSELSPSIIIDFFKSSLGPYISNVKSSACTLRGLLRFLYESKVIKLDLSTYVPKIRNNKNATVPSTYNKEEITKLLDSIDRGNPKGKRDYAMLQVICRLGLRTSDLINLKFENINWEKCIIEFTQQKTGRSIILPLLNQVGDAIIDYLKYARHKVDSPFIFLRQISPYHALDKSTVHYIVHRRLLDAGINIPPDKRHGAHSLRHSLASLLLKNNTLLPIISESLGHVNTETTMYYLKIDIEQLRKCSLGMPVVSSILDEENENA